MQKLSSANVLLVGIGPLGVEIGWYGTTVWVLKLESLTQKVCCFFVAKNIILAGVKVCSAVAWIKLCLWCATLRCFTVNHDKWSPNSYDARSWKSILLKWRTRSFDGQQVEVLSCLNVLQKISKTWNNKLLWSGCRAEACASKLAELNPYVKVKVQTQELLPSPSLNLTEFQVKKSLGKYKVSPSSNYCNKLLRCFF